MQADSLPAKSQGEPKNTGVGSLSLLQGDLPDPGIKLVSPALQVASLPTEVSEKPQPRSNRQIFRKAQSRKTEPGKIENMNRSITSNEMESVILKLTINKSLGPDGFTDEFYQTFREELLITPILLKLFQKVAEKTTLPNSFYDTSFTLIPKSKIPQKRKLQANITD